MSEELRDLDLERRVKGMPDRGEQSFEAARSMTWSWQRGGHRPERTVCVRGRGEDAGRWAGLYCWGSKYTGGKLASRCFRKGVLSFARWLEWQNIVVLALLTEWLGYAFSAEKSRKVLPPPSIFYTPHTVLSLLHAYAGSILAIQWGSYSFIRPMKGLWHREFSNLPKVSQPISVRAGIESRRSGSTGRCCLTTLWVQKTLGNISALLLTSPLGGYLGVGEGHFRKPLFPSSFFLPWWSGGPAPGPTPHPLPSGSCGWWVGWCN